ncbi:MAG: LysR family transcriptional regulator [Gammaproteobacteria bacterium]|nr:LysR family transcriptional regulator [Gammaproteobacteria bacterium]
MDIQNLTAFISISETGSFSRAAEKLFLTQPAVSKRIAALEQELRIKLFDRIGKTVQLTEAGLALLPGAKRILAELEESRRVIRNLSGKIGGPLRLGTSHHIGLHRLPPVLRSFTAEHPDVDLDIKFMDSEAACEAILKGELELAIATLPEQPNSNLSTDIIWHDPLGVIVNRGHPLARNRITQLDQLIEYPAILPSHSTFTRALLEQAFGLDTRKLNIAMETNYLETIKMMVSIGLGWSVLPVSMLSKELRDIKVEGIHMERQLGVAYHAERTLSNAARALLDILHQ